MVKRSSLQFDESLFEGEARPRRGRKRDEGEARERQPRLGRVDKLPLRSR